MYTLYTVYYCNVHIILLVIKLKYSSDLKHILSKNQKLSTSNAAETKQCCKNVLSNV